MELKIRVLIIDDEHLARRRIASLLRNDRDVEVIGMAASSREALRILEKEDADLIFLDIQMPGMDGFEFLGSLQQDPPPVVVFVTAFDEHAIRAFEAQALDYILKPYDEERFQKALNRAKRLVKKREPKKPLHRLSVKVGDKWVFVRLDDVDWIEAEGKYARLHTATSSYLLRGGLQQLESQLDGERFLRIHRSAIVNVDRIREIRALFHGDSEAILRDGTRLTVSRRYRSNLLKN
jgi:two-component system, LytTR family, response regulator